MTDAGLGFGLTVSGRRQVARLTALLVAAGLVTMPVGIESSAGAAGPAAFAAPASVVESGSVRAAAAVVALPKGSCAGEIAVGAIGIAGGIAGGAVLKAGMRGFARTAARSCSFAGSTTVLMADGSHKAIEDVEVGDLVIATDPETGRQVAKKVERVFVHDDTVVDLIVGGEVITTTEDHPFWSVTDRQFERADELSAGELVLDANGRTAVVSGLKLGTERSAAAYNLSVAGIHTYHVGAAEVLVHNTCAAPWLDELGARKVTSDHMTGIAGKSQFNADEDLYDLAEESGRVSGIHRADGRCERVCDMGRNVGSDLNGDPTSLMTVISNPNGQVITMHPGMPRP